MDTTTLLIIVLLVLLLGGGGWYGRGRGYEVLGTARPVLFFDPLSGRSARSGGRHVRFKSRLMQCSNACPLYPRKQTCAVQLAMSAKGQKRT